MRALVVGLVIAGTAPADADATCPLARVTTKAPKLTTVKSVDAARRLLLLKSVGMQQELDIFEKLGSGTGVSADVRRNYEHGGDSSYWDSSAVFVMAKRVVIAHQLAKWAIVIPEECSSPHQDKILDVRVVAAGKRSIGHVRVRRVLHSDKPTLTAVAPTRQTPCNKTATYRLEEHFIDLAKRRELLVLASAYDGPVYEDHPVPLGFDALQIGASGVMSAEAGCTPFKWRP